ncbi:MAG: chorismate-binding protein [Bacteroides sp.]|nr:chorismate-binding protein [Bacteroides sp.]
MMDLNEIIGGPYWYAWSEPGNNDILFGAATKAVEGLHPGGFAISPFNGKKTDTLTLVPQKEIIVNSSAIKTHPEEIRRGEKVPAAEENEEAPEWYREAILRIKDELKKRGGGKIVLSRTREHRFEIGIAERILQLRKRYPDAFIFAFATPETGLWYGASPEILLYADGSEFHTVALAGTRLRGSAGEWDEKNREEQRMVTDFILDSFRKENMIPKEQGPETKPAGPVEHIMTRISAPIPADVKLEDFLENLSPTPALCGSDRELSLRILEEIEEVPRKMYGGWCGPFFDNMNFLFHVNLRSAEIMSDGRHILHVGGGITLLSDADAEWEETRRKASTLIW